MITEHCTVESSSHEAALALVSEAREIVERAPNLQSLLPAWITGEGRSIVLENAVDDEQEDLFIGIAITLRDYDLPVLALYFTFSQIEQMCGSIRPISDHVELRSDDDDFCGVGLEVDEQKVRAALGFDPCHTYVDELANYVLSAEQAFKMAVMFASAEVGQATIELVDRDELDLDDEVESELLRTPLAVMFLHYQELVSRGGLAHGFTEVKYVPLSADASLAHPIQH